MSANSTQMLIRVSVWYISLIVIALCVFCIIAVMKNVMLHVISASIHVMCDDVRGLYLDISIAEQHCLSYLYLVNRQLDLHEFFNMLFNGLDFGSRFS